MEGVASLPASGAFLAFPDAGWAALKRLLLLAVFWLAAWGAGEGLARRLKAEPRWFYGLVLGSGALSLLGLLLGMAGLFHATLLRMVLALLATWGASRLEWRRPSLPRTWAWLAVVPFAAGTFVLAQAPVTFYDALVYHLSLPDLYMRRGAIEAVPTVVFAGLPAGQQMLYAYLLALGDPPLCQLLAWSQGLLTCAALIHWGGAAGVWASAVWLSSPMVVLQASRPGTEMAGSLYLAGTMLGAPLVSGLCAGLAMGSKYQAGAVLLAGALLHRRALRPYLAGALVFVPWLLKNAWLYGSPVFPIGASKTLMDSGEPLGLSPLTVWRSFFPHPEIMRDSGLSAAYLLALPPLVAARWGDKAKKALLFFVAAFLPLAFATGILRYQIPALVPLSLLAGAVLAQLPVAAPPLFLGLFLRCFAALAPYGDLWQTQPGYPAPPYKAYVWMNEHLPKDAKVLLVDEDKSFYLERDRVPSSLFSPQAVSLEGVTHVFVNYADVNGTRTREKLPLGRLTEVWRDGDLAVYAASPDR